MLVFLRCWVSFCKNYYLQATYSAEYSVSPIIVEAWPPDQQGQRAEEGVVVDFLLSFAQCILPFWGHRHHPKAVNLGETLG